MKLDDLDEPSIFLSFSSYPSRDIYIYIYIYDMI